MSGKLGLYEREGGELRVESGELRVESGVQEGILHCVPDSF